MLGAANEYSRYPRCGHSKLNFTVYSQCLDSTDRKQVNSCCTALGVCGTQWKIFKKKKLSWTHFKMKKLKKWKLTFCVFFWKNTCRNSDFSFWILSKYFSSCSIPAHLVLLSHLCWQLVRPIQHGSTSFLASYSAGINERWQRQNQRTETAVNYVKLNRNHFLPTAHPYVT